MLSNIENKNIINKLYIKILKLSQEYKVSTITFNCFQKLLSPNMDEDSIYAVIDFISYIKKNNLINNNNLKHIITLLFFSISKFIETNPKLLEQFNSIINDIFDTTDIMNIDKILAIESNENKGCLLHFLMFLTTSFSPYYNSYDEFIGKRNEIKTNLEYMLLKNIPICLLKDISIIPVSNFYLSYQGIPSVDIFNLKSQLIRKICPELNYNIDTTFKNDKINICFHSNFLTRWHSVFKDRHEIIKALSLMDDYNVYFTTFDDLTNEVKFLFGNAKHIKLPTSLDNVKNTLEKLKLDVLVYCEIGMDPRAYFMAHMRLAKIQINTWGHSDTCGINTVDYFFSSKLYELPYHESQKHYSEKLVLLDSLCTCYINPLLRYNTLKFKDRYEFGFTDEVTIFFCAQSLFKFNPIFDDYIIDILIKNNNFVLILLNNDSKQKIIKRLNNKNITSQIHIFPGMDHLSYLNLIKISDIILDPYPFGGCNSSLEAFSLGKIVITCASNMINGRFTSGFYIKMGLENLITYNKNDYVELALKFVSNKDYKYEIEDIIIKNNHLLFNEKESINDWNIQIKNIINYKL